MKINWKKTIFSLALAGSILFNLYLLIDTGITNTYTAMSIAHLQEEKAQALFVINEFVPKLSNQELHRLLHTLESKHEDMFIKEEEDGVISAGEISFRPGKKGYVADYYGN